MDTLRRLKTEQSHKIDDCEKKICRSEDAIKRLRSGKFNLEYVKTQLSQYNAKILLLKTKIEECKEKIDDVSLNGTNSCLYLRHLDEIKQNTIIAKELGDIKIQKKKDAADEKKRKQLEMFGNRKKFKHKPKSKLHDKPFDPTIDYAFEAYLRDTKFLGDKLAQRLETMSSDHGLKCRNVVYFGKMPARGHTEKLELSEMVKGKVMIHEYNLKTGEYKYYEQRRRNNRNNRRNNDRRVDNRRTGNRRADNWNVKRQKTTLK